MDDLAGALQELVAIGRWFQAFFSGPPVQQARQVQDNQEFVIAARLRLYCYVLAPTALTLISINFPGVQIAIPANQLTPIPNFDGARYTTTGQNSPVDITLFHTNEKLT